MIRSVFRKFFPLTVLCVAFSGLSVNGQTSLKWTNPAYRYYSMPGFVNIVEISGASGMGGTETEYSKNFIGIADIFGYQISRNFFQGAGLGYYIYFDGSLFPAYLDSRYYKYFKKSTGFLFFDGGLLLYPTDIFNETRIFLNPGAGIAKPVSPKYDISIGAGLMVQMGNEVPRTSFINLKLGLTFKKNNWKRPKHKVKIDDICFYL